MKKPLLNISFILAFSFGHTQSIGIHSIGGIGLFNSEPVYINQVSSCLLVNNGLSVFLTNLINGQGNFWSYCIDAEKDFTLTAYPNPTENKIFVRPKSIIDKNETFFLKVINSSGQQLQQMTIKGDFFQQGFYIDMNGYAIGIYFISIQSSSKNYQVKVIKGVHL